MTQAAPAGNGRPSRRRRIGRVLGGVAFALTPWLSLGFGTPVAFILAAALYSHLGKVHAVVLWLSAAIYTAALIVGIAESDSAPGTTGDHVVTACLLITMVVGGLQALAFAIVAGVNGYRPALGRATQAATTEAEPATRPHIPPQPVVAAGSPPPVGPNRGPNRGRNRRALRRWGLAGVIASLICFVLSLALFIVPVLMAQRAEASDPGSGEGYGFIAVLSIFPCFAAVALLVVALVLLSISAAK
jgi:hypothetical protein